MNRGREWTLECWVCGNSMIRRSGKKGWHPTHKGECKPQYSPKSGKLMKHCNKMSEEWWCGHEGIWVFP